jgi:hypothetical protein
VEPGAPVVMPQWLKESESEWRGSDLERQARQQKDREEQHQKLRRMFYRFLNVDAE